ncbi:MAG: ABC transporter ATP-binding protein [Ilumatobacter sp.]|nr:ABC transporter ATP-binding protein [Ilumatobacter sp.]
MTALQFDHVTKRFGKVVALDDVSLEIADHEILALVGPSGCGKSTLLRSIAGIHPVDGGTIRLGDRVVDDGRVQLPPERRRVGLVFQEHALFPHLSVADNVGFGVRDDTATARSYEMLELVGMTDYAERFPHELSGGERQRVALARALAPRPELMLLDEPFASLDTNLRARVRDDVVEILRSTRTPAVFVTHDQHDALAVGDRIAVLRGGRVVQVGTPVEVFHRPVDRFVASFMGEASYVPFADAADVSGLADDLGDPAAVAPAADRALMLRPDDIVLEPGDGAVVEHAEFRGTVWCYTVLLANGARVKSLRNHLEPVEVGTRVRAVLRPGHHPVIVDG